MNRQRQTPGSHGSPSPQDAQPCEPRPGPAMAGCSLPYPLAADAGPAGPSARLTTIGGRRSMAGVEYTRDRPRVPSPVEPRLEHGAHGGLSSMAEHRIVAPKV